MRDWAIVTFLKDLTAKRVQRLQKNGWMMNLEVLKQEMINITLWPMEHVWATTQFQAIEANSFD